MLNRLSALNRYFLRKMSTKSAIFVPPLEVKGMTTLDKSKFKRNVDIPFIKVPSKIISRIIGASCLREVALRNSLGLRTITASDNEDEKLILFDPQLLAENADSKDQIRETIKNITGVDVTFAIKNFEIDYRNWDIKRCVDAILPDNLSFTGHTQAGHIVHVNLREELLPYRFVLGEILLDKIKSAKTVVNKLDKISSEFRFFELELLAGEPNYIITVIENKFKYKLDFSKVFWNSRLGTEHERIIIDIKSQDRPSIVFDVFAGVGPFVIPAVFYKKIIKAYANDLNPLAIEYLNENLKLNDVRTDKIDVYNLDGAEFIRTILPIAYEKHCKDNADFHILMNLPALAVSFLPAFKGALKDFAHENNQVSFFVHCYMFVKAKEDQPYSWFDEQAVKMVKDQIPEDKLEICELTYVRNVAGRKHMYCVKFKLQFEYLVSSTTDEDYSVAEKKQKIEA